MLTRFGHSLTKFVDRFELVLNYLSVTLLSAMVLFATADVIARYIFNHPIRGALESYSLLMAGGIFLIMGYVQSTKSNIVLDLFVSRYPPRAKYVVDLVVLVITLGLFSLIAWQSFGVAFKDISSGRLIENIFIPVYPFEFLLTFGAVMVCIESILQIVRLVYQKTRKVI